MELPAILTTDLRDVARCQSDKELFEYLRPATDRLVKFFSLSSEDETWSEKHIAFHQLTLNWLTNQYEQNRLGDPFAKAIVNAVHDHYSIYKDILPRTLQIQSQNSSHLVNPLIVASKSRYIRDFLRQGQKKLVFRDFTDLQLEFIFNYLETEDVGNLWKWEEREIQAILQIAEQWEIESLTIDCQKILLRYIDRENVVKKLHLAVKKNREVLLERCLEVFNANFDHVIASSARPQKFVLEFLDFTEKALESFAFVKDLVTHLSFRGSLASKEPFGQTLQECKKLIGLILSGSDAPFREIPSSISHQIYEMDLGQCSWLTDQELRKILESMPWIQDLSLAQNTQLTYVGFGELKKLQGLKALNLSNCHHLEDRDLGLILSSIPELRSLDLSGCRGISEIEDFRKRFSKVEILA